MSGPSTGCAGRPQRPQRRSAHLRDELWHLIAVEGIARVVRADVLHLARAACGSSRHKSRSRALRSSLGSKLPQQAGQARRHEARVLSLGGGAAPRLGAALERNRCCRGLSKAAKSRASMPSGVESLAGGRAAGGRRRLAHRAAGAGRFWMSGAAAAERRCDGRSRERRTQESLALLARSPRARLSSERVRAHAPSVPRGAAGGQVVFHSVVRVRAPRSPSRLVRTFERAQVHARARGAVHKGELTRLRTRIRILIASRGPLLHTLPQLERPIWT